MSAYGRVAAAGIDMVTDSSDCGDMPNACVQGVISSTVVMGTVATMTGLRMSTATQTRAVNAYNLFDDAYSGSGSGITGVPCGSGWNTTYFDSFLLDAAGLTASDGGSPVELCEGLTGDADVACSTLWAGSTPQSGDVFPRCPTALYADTASWGTCTEYQYSCRTVDAYYNDTEPRFMDWWTIFYWAWWITWAPFVGFFVALISRGRTVREVVIGGFICPTLFAILWFSVFGGLAIKMEKTAELALGVRPDIAHALVDCSEHYDGGTPITPEAKKLAEAGYYMLTCLPPNDQIYALMLPYKTISGFLHLVLWLGLVIYFLTSSDSGSMTDDIISASGLTPGSIPAWQKVFWCATEGAVACALVKTGGALGAVRNVSIIIGLPFTALLCMMVPSLYRIVKKEAGDTDILEGKKFNTQLLDILELFSPKKQSPCPPGTHATKLGLSLFVPFLPVRAIMAKLQPEAPLSGLFTAVAVELLHLAWFFFQCTEAAEDYMHVLGWVCFVGFVSLLTFARVAVRKMYNVWGSPADDVTVALFLYPFALSQMWMMVETDGKDAPAYFEDADDVIEQMASLTSEQKGKNPTTEVAMA
jgi:hypothetical protein